MSITSNLSSFKDGEKSCFSHVPNDWKIVDVKHLFDVYNGSTPKSTDDSFWNGDISWITPADMTSTKFVGKSSRSITTEGFESCNLTMADPGDIVLSCRAPIGSVNVVSSPLCTNQGCKLLKPKVDVNTSFYYYCLFCQNKVLNFLGRGTTFMELSTDDLRNFKVPMPDVEVQHQIARYLDSKCNKIDDACHHIALIIQKYVDLKQSIITEVVTKGLDEKISTKDSGVSWIGSIPTNWDTVRLKTITSVPLQYGANESGVPYDEELPRYIRITDIVNNNLSESNMKSLPKNIAEDYMLDDGDILFARSGATVGKTYQYRKSDGNCAFAGYLIRAKFPNHAISDFVYYYTKSYSYSEWIKNVFIQSTIENIGAGKYRDMYIPLPPVYEQIHISEYIKSNCEKLDSIINAYNESVSKLIDYKSSLIYEYVTGKKSIYEAHR